MKNLYYFLFLVLVSVTVKAQIVTIPDANFKNKLLNYQPVIDTNSDGEIQVSEALVVTVLNISSENEPRINNLSGLEYFTNLTELDCSYNNLWDLEVVSNLTNLVNLFCNENELTNLNVSNLINLQSLNCNDNNLITLILNNATNLKKIVCFGNNLNTVDLSSQVNLTDLGISGQSLVLDFSTCINLINLQINYLNSAATLNLTPLINLETLSLYEVSTALDVSNLFNLKKLFFVESSEISSLNLGSISSLIELNCSSSNLDSIDVSNLINLKKFNCYGNDLNTLDVSNNIALTELNFGDNNINSIDLSSNTNLTDLNCSYNNLNTIDLSNNTNLTDLNCSYNNLNTIDVSNLNNLIKFNCSYNLLNTINVSNLLNLKGLDCSNNLLTTLDLSSLVNLEYLVCMDNQLTSLDLQNLILLYQVFCSNNLFTSLDFSKVNNPYNSQNRIEISDNPNLIYLNLKNGTGFDYEGNNNFFGYNNPNLVFVCANEGDVQIVQSLVYPFTQVNSYCSFVPGGINNLITGTISLDVNNNGCDNTDLPAMATKVNINDSVVSSTIFTNNLGKYSFYTQTGNFTMTPEFENPYFISSPLSAILNFPLLDGTTQNQNFCITPNGIHNDLEIIIMPLRNARPGFDATYQLVYKNKGNQTLSGNINLVFDDAVLDFVSANPALSAQTLNTLNWSYNNLLPFESRTIDFTLNVNSPMETPAVNIDDVLHFTASIDPVSGDETTADNTFAFAQTVIGSFDPNDKICLEGNTITPEKVGDYLHYIIHFQNSGTAAAENIVVKDVIDTTKFDIASLQLISASHPYETKVTGDKIEFIFENIQLPAEIDNEPASHGFVAFKIKTKSDLVLGNTVSNKADIYFDYNFPIITNTAVTTVSVLGVNEFENKSVSVFPNPVSDILNITSKGSIKTVQVYDVQGRLTDTFLKDEEKTTINLSNKKTGAYFVKIFTDKGVKVEKVVKK